MPVISFFCLLIFLLLLISGLRKNANILSPGRVFGMLWAFVIGLVEFKFSHLQIQWNLFDWFMVLLGLMTFLIGIYTAYIINLENKFLSVAEIRKIIKKTEINEFKLFWFILIWFSICLVAFIVEWQIRGFIPLFTSNPTKARVEFGVFILHYIVNSINVVLFLIIEYYVFIKGNNKKKIFLAALFLISLGNYILILHRYGFFLLLMMAFCFIYYSGRRIKLRTFIVFGSLVILLIIGIQSLRATQLVQAYVVLESKMKFSDRYSEFAIPYMYIAMNLENFVKYYSEIISHSYGSFTFEFLTNSVGISSWIAEYFNFDKFKLHIGGYNTFPFYWPYYYDFGITGLAIVPFIIGFIISNIYYRLHRNPNMVALTLYAVAFAVIVISYTSDPLTRLDMMLNFVVIVVAQYFIINNGNQQISKYLNVNV